MSLKLRLFRAQLCLLVFIFALSTSCFGQTSAPTALPYTMTTIAGATPKSTTANSACPTLASATATDTFGDGCPAVNGVFGAAGRGGVVTDSFGNVFVADDINKIVHMINPTTGIMTRIAGGGTACSGKLDSDGDGCLASTQTALGAPRGIGTDPYGNILIPGYGDNLIHLVCRTASPLCTSAQIGSMKLVAGCSTSTGSGGTAGVGLDNTVAMTTSAGTCSTSKGEVDAPRGAAADLYGNIYFADTSSSRTRVVLGPQTSSYFSGNNPLWAALSVYYPSLTAGYAYTVVNTSGTSTTTGGTATTLGQSCSVTTNSITYSGTASDTYGDGCPLEFSSIAASSGFTSGVAVDAAGNMLFTDPTHGLRVLFVQGWTSAAAATSAGATGAVATAGVAMYNAIANNSGVTPQAGFIYMLAGGGTTTLSNAPAKGNGTSITDSTITKLAVSPQGNIYIGDSNRILFFDINTGYIRVLFTGGANVTAGNYCNGSSGQTSLSAYSDGCPAFESLFSNSSGLGVSVDGQGNLYLYDAASNSSGMLVRKILAQGFAPQTLGTSLTQTFQVHLPETTSATVSSPTATLTTSPDMSVGTPSCSQNADNSVDCSVSVTTTPTAAGQRSATLTVALPSGTWENPLVNIGLGGTVSGSVLALDSASTSLSGTTTPIAPATNTIFSSISPVGVALDGAGNVYAMDQNSGSILESVQGSGSTTISNTLPASPGQIAVDQQGNVFAVGSGTATIEELEVSGAPTSPGAPSAFTRTTISYTPISGTAAPQAIAVDTAGNLFVADKQSTTANTAIYRLSLTPNTPPSQVTVATGFANPVSLAVDGSGNIYVADKGAGAVYKLTPGATGAYTQTTALSSIAPVAVAVDPAGDVYVQDLNSASVLEVPVSGPGTVTILTGLASPAGLAVDGKGNVYSADSNNTSITQVVRGAVSYNFGTNESISFNGTLINVGNAAVTGSNPATSSTNFNIVAGSSNGCPLTNNALGALTAGQGCALSATLVGAGTGTVSDVLSFLPSASTTGSLTLTGTLQGTAVATTTTITGPQETAPTYSVAGTEATFTVTVTAQSGSNAPNGTVTVTVDSTTTFSPLTASGLSGIATVTISGLKAGTHTISAVYPTGSFNGSSSGATTFTIAPVSTSVIWNPGTTTQQVSQAIGTGVLDASVTPNVAGNFTYTATPAGGSATAIDSSSYLPIGAYSLAVTFTPNDSTDYITATATVGTYTVAKANATALVGASTNVVAADGSGNYTSLSAALASLPTTGGTIYLKPGTYTGQNTVSYPNISLRGLGGDPTKVILTAEDGAFSAPFVYPGSGPGNANASGDQGSSTLNVAKSAYIGNQATAGNVTYSPNGFYAEYLTIQNTYNTSTATTTTYATTSGSCADTGISHTLQSLYNSGTQCNSQALALWITADQAVLNNVNLTGQQDTLYAGSQGCSSSTCTAARQYMWKGMITGDVDYAFGDAAMVFDHTNFFTAWHGTSAGGTTTIEAQNKKFQTGSSGDYLSGYICNSCILLSQSTGMGNLYFGRPYGAYSTWVMLNSYVDQVNPAGWIEFTAGVTNNLPTSTYAEYNTQPFTDPAVGTSPYPATLFGGTVTPAGGNTGSGVTGTRETTSLDPGTIESSNTIKTSLTAAEAAQYYPVTFLSAAVPTQSYSGFTTNWNPVSALATKLNAFVPTTSVGTLPSGSSVTILGRPQTPGAGLIPTGTYAFYDSLGNNQVCTSASGSCTALASGNLDASGEASLTTNSLAAGQHYITMVYGGDTNFNSSTSSVYSIYVLAPGQIATTTTLTVNNLSSTTGTTVTGSLMVSPSAATGTVSLVLDGATATTCTLSSGSCSWSLTAVPTGVHTLYASYPGNSSYGLSTSSNTTLEVLTPAATGDTRTVTEPSFPTVCQQLTAALTTDPAIQDLDTSVDATVSNPDGARIQAALNSCSATAVASNTNLAVELSMDNTGTYNAFLTGPLSMPSNVTLLVNPAVTVYFSRNVQDYDKVSGTHTCGTINGASNTGSCLPLIDIPKNSTNAGIMGYGKLNGRGGDLLINAFATSGYAPPSTYTWWNLAAQANGEGNQQNPRFIQMDSGSSNITLYKITILNSPNFHVSTTGAVTNFTAWDIKVITPTNARNTDGIDPGNMQNATITGSWVSEGDDNIAIGAPNTVPAKNISVTNNHFYAGHGESIGSLTGAGVSNILFDGNMSAGNASAGHGSAIANAVADSNSTAIHIKSANDRGGLVTGIQYSNSCFLDHKTDIQITPYYSSGDSTSLFPSYTNILMQNLVFLNDAGSQGTVELTGEYNSNNGSTIINPLGITFDNVTFPSTLSSLVNSTTPVESSSVWGSGNFSGGTGQYVNLTAGPGQVSSNFLNAYTTLVNNSANSDTLTNNIVQGSLNPPNCVFTYLAPELTGPTGFPQTIPYGTTATLDVILTPTVGGAAYPNGTVTLQDAQTGNTFTGTFNGSGDTLAVSIPASDLTLGTHTFSAISYTGDSNYTVPAAYQTFGSYVVTVTQATPTITAWPTASAITYGQTLASSTLTGGLASVPGIFAFTSPTTTLGAGTSSQSVTFTPTDTTNYTTVSGSVSVTVSQIMPTVTTWPMASTITYGQTLASSTLTGGSASVPGTFAFTTPTTTPGAGTSSQSVTFTPTDSTNYTTVSGTVSVTVNQATPTVSTWPIASAITYGQMLASSTLSGGSALVAGTFAFATPTTTPSAGTSSQSVIFSPNDSTDYTTVTGTVNVTVNKATPIASLSASSTSITTVQSITLTASITAPSGSPSAPGGSVTFVAGSTILGTATLSNGVATLTVDGNIFPVGGDSVTANYSGNGNFLSVSSTALTVTVAKAPVTVGLAASQTSITAAQTTTLTAAVSAPAGATIVPTGSVIFMAGSTVLGSANLSGGVAALTVTGSQLGIGSATVTASYSGDGDFLAANSGSIALTVSQSPAVVGLTENQTSITKLQTAVLTATVSAPGGSTVIPTGTVTFMDGYRTLGSAALVGGSASLSAPGMELSLGNHTITAIYSGDSNFLNATSAGLTLTVTKASPTVTLTAQEANITRSQNDTLTVSVGAPSGSSVSPMGFVTFVANSKILGFSILSGGRGTLEIHGNWLPKGSSSITAFYSGDKIFFPGNSSPLVITVTGL